MVREGLEVVLVSELKAEEEGVVWMGDEESEVVLIDSGRAGVCIEGGDWKGGLRRGSRSGLGKGGGGGEVGGSFTSPVREEMIMWMWKKDVERWIEMGADNRLVIGGDFNDSVGRNSERQ